MYALHVERIERAHLVDMQTAALVRAQGGEVDAGSLNDRLREFDEWLVAEPPKVDTEVAEWRQAMGLGVA